MHSIVLDLLSIVAQTGQRQEAEPVIGSVVCHPSGHLIPELHLRTDDERIPGDHLVEVTGLYGDVMKLSLDRRHISSPRGSSTAPF
jgi:hypothetical protein